MFMEAIPQAHTAKVTEKRGVRENNRGRQRGKVRGTDTRWRKEGEFYYCGKPGHFIIVCHTKAYDEKRRNIHKTRSNYNRLVGQCNNPRNQNPQEHCEQNPH